MKTLLNLCVAGLMVAATTAVTAQDGRYRGDDDRRGYRDSQGYWHWHDQGYGYGQPGQPGQPGQQQPDYGSSGQQGTLYQYLGQYGRAQNLRGTITELREVQLEGRPQPHLLAKVRLQDNYLVVADLGGSRRLQNQQVQFNQGQQVTLSGIMGRINDRPVFVVDQVLTADNRTIITRRLGSQAHFGAGQPGQQSQSYGQYPPPYGYSSPNQPGSYIIRGQITAVEDVTVPGMERRQRLLTVRTDQGQTVLVNAGDRPDALQKNLRDGQRIEAFGSPGTLDGRSVITATSVTNITGQSSPTDRSSGNVIRGRITAVEDVTVPGLERRQRLLTVRTDAGQTVLVNAGDRPAALEKNLRRGQQVEVFGSPGTLDGRSVITATTVNNITSGNPSDLNDED